MPSKNLMRRDSLCALVLLLSTLACGQYVTATPTTVATTLTPTVRPAAQATHAPAPATEEPQTAKVVAPAVNVRRSPGGEVVRQIYAGQAVDIVGECADGWCQIKADDSPALGAGASVSGWVWQGCLSVNPSGLGCEAR